MAGGLRQVTRGKYQIVGSGCASDPTFHRSYMLGQGGGAQALRILLLCGEEGATFGHIQSNSFARCGLRLEIGSVVERGPYSRAPKSLRVCR